MATARPELDEQERREFHAWMDEDGVRLRCPICGGRDSTNQSRVSMLTMDDPTKLEETKHKAVQIECEGCGYLLRFGGRTAEPFSDPPRSAVTRDFTG